MLLCIQCRAQSFYSYHAFVTRVGDGFKELVDGRFVQFHLHALEHSANFRLRH
jgi:hypothetical protein